LILDKEPDEIGQKVARDHETQVPNDECHNRSFASIGPSEEGTGNAARRAALIGSKAIQATLNEHDERVKSPSRPVFLGRGHASGELITGLTVGQ
jgi:hypothetical protein